MKKLILVAAFAVCYGVSTAQVSFGFQAGANIAMGKYTNAEDPLFPLLLTNKPQVGLLVGVVGEIPIGTSLAFRPELNFIQKGSKSIISQGSFTGELKRTLNYIQLPLNVVYKLPVGSGNLFFGLGPELAFGISGKDKFTDDFDPTNNENYSVKFDGKKYEDITDPNDNDTHLKRFDVGANIIAGYRMGMGLTFKLGYTYNFMDIDPNKDATDPLDRTSYKNRGFNICVGFMIGGSKNAE